jgi:hypothetical protein
MQDAHAQFWSYLTGSVYWGQWKKVWPQDYMAIQAYRINQTTAPVVVSKFAKALANEIYLHALVCG